MSAVTPGSDTDGDGRSAGPRRGRRAARADIAVVVGPVLLAAVLTLISLTGRSLGFDEGATVAIVSQHGTALWHAIERDGGNMSGYYVLMHVLVGAFGDGPWVLRLPSMVFAALTPGVVAAIALVLWADRRPAALAAVLSAVDVALVYWGQTARGYAAMTCLACASMLAFVLLARAVREGRPWWPAAVAYVLVTTGAAYCGFIVLLIVPAQLIALAGSRRALMRFAAPVVAVALLSIPLALLALARGSGQLFWVPRPNQQVDSQVMQSLTGSGLQSTFHRLPTTTTGWIATSVVLLAAIAYIVWLRRRAGVADGDRLAGWGMLTVLVWLVLPGLVTFLVSLVAQPMFQPRNLLASGPALALALALVLCDRRLPRWLAGVAIVLALLIRAVPLAASYSVSPEPWRDASARVLATSRPGDCVAFYPEDARNAFRWYAARAGALRRPGAVPRSVLPAVPWSSTRPYVEIYRTLSSAQISALAPRCRRMWLVSSHEGQRHGPPVAVSHRERWLAFRERLQHVFGHGPVVSLGWASVIHIELMPGRSGR